jgi:hypothetical protein
MHANKANLCSAVLALTLFAADSMAQGAPILPPLPVLGSVVNQNGQMIAQPLPGGKAIAAQVAASAGKDLTYRDPSVYISINEVSELQAKKAGAELYKKFGLTDVSPIMASIAKGTPGDSSIDATAKPAPVVRKLQVVTLAIWGRNNSLQAEAMIDGVLRKIINGDTIAPGVVVKAISAKGLQLEVTKLPHVKKRTSVNPANSAATSAPVAEAKQKTVHAASHAKRIAKPAAALPTQNYWAYVGRITEMNL